MALPAIHPRSTINTIQLHSPPASRPGQTCWHCTNFVALAYAGTAAKRMYVGRLRVQAAPTTGCAYGQREVGADDEPGSPGNSAACGSLIASEQRVA